MPQRRDSAGAECNSVMGMLLLFCGVGEENGLVGAQLFYLEGGNKDKQAGVK